MQQVCNAACACCHHNMFSHVGPGLRTRCPLGHVQLHVPSWTCGVGSGSRQQEGSRGVGAGAPPPPGWVSRLHSCLQGNHRWAPTVVAPAGVCWWPQARRLLICGQLFYLKCTAARGASRCTVVLLPSSILEVHTIHAPSRATHGCSSCCSAPMRWVVPLSTTQWLRHHCTTRVAAALSQL